MNCQMVSHNTHKNNSILMEVFASVFTVSSYFTDNPRIFDIMFYHLTCLCKNCMASLLWLAVGPRSL